MNYFQKTIFFLCYPLLDIDCQIHLYALKVKKLLSAPRTTAPTFISCRRLNVEAIFFWSGNLSFVWHRLEAVVQSSVLTETYLA